jgi:hypothetical protein
MEYGQALVGKLMATATSCPSASCPWPMEAEAEVVRRRPPTREARREAADWEEAVAHP